MDKSISLLELNKSIQEILKKGFPESLWIIAEISELKINRNGHCYLEVIEKDIISENILARCRATIWAFTFRMVKPYFESITSQELTPGLKILFKANVEFHESYGLSLNIIDIDPNYTLGDLARKRAETIKKLESDGIINMNKDLELPQVVQRIAIVSSETAAGYQDFINQLLTNNHNYVFYTKIFPSIMQGEQAEESIIQALDKVFNFESLFDIVVIIRGGGSQADLNCFNNYLLASHVAQFPIPILTGIGHEKDESVVDIVANVKLKTPTAVAEFIISRCLEFENYINDLGNNVSELINNYLDEQNNTLNQIISLIGPTTKNLLLKEKHNLVYLKHKTSKYSSGSIAANNRALSKLIFKSRLSLKDSVMYQKEILSNLNQKIINHSKTFLLYKEYKVNLWETNLKLLDPMNILKRGYSITNYRGKVLIDSSILQSGDEILTILNKGEVKSKII